MVNIKLTNNTKLIVVLHIAEKCQRLLTYTLEGLYMGKHGKGRDPEENFCRKISNS